MTTYERIILSDLMTYERARVYLLTRVENTRMALTSDESSKVVASPVIEVVDGGVECVCHYHLIP